MIGNLLIAGGLFSAFLFLAWWIAWKLSLSKVPLLRELLGEGRREKERKEKEKAEKERRERGRRRKSQ